MATIVNRPPSWAEALSTGLGQGIEQLAQSKIQELTLKKQQDKLGNFYESIGLPRGLIYAPEKIQQAYLQGASALGALGQQQQQAPQAMNFQENIAPQQQQAVNLPEILQSLQLNQPQEIKAPSTGLMQAPEGLQQPLKMGKLPERPSSEEVMARKAAFKQQKAAGQQAAGKPTGAQIISEGLRNPAERIAEKKMAQQKELADREFKQKERAEAFKQTKAERNQIVQEYKASKDIMHDLNRFEELEAEGKLDTPGYIEMLKRSGLDIPTLMEPGSEEFQKISANFMRDAKTYFGGRVSNFEIEQFMKTVPSLSQSPEGRKRVIANLKRFNRGKEEYYKAYKDIMQRNKDVPPLDLMEQVQDRADESTAKIAELFRKDLARPVPKGQNKLITALQTGIGSVAGKLPKIATGAGIGAYAGSGFGPAGTAIGAGLGALGGLSGISLKELL